MASTARAERRLPLRWLAWAVAVGAGLAVFPPFHVRPLEQGVAVPRAASGAVDVSRVAAQIWSRLAQPAAEPLQLHTLLTAIGQSPAKAMEKYGHRAGIGGSAFFFVGGEASVSAVERDGVWLTADVANALPALLTTGPIFGSALRDASGLVDIDNFSSADFNALAAELNQLAETRVQPLVRAQVRAGSRIAFLAAAEYDDATRDRPFLRLVPVRVTPGK